jgi:hypothetical protein
MQPAYQHEGESYREIDRQAEDAGSFNAASAPLFSGMR